MMKTASLVLVVLFVLSALLVASTGSVAAADTGCTHTYSAPPAQQWTISSPGIYCLKAGTYNTQINITASNVLLTPAPGTKAGQVIIEPSSVLENNFINWYFGAEPQAAIILAGSSDGSSLTGISITNLVIDGAKASSSLDNYAVCTTDYAGINLNGASGSIVNDLVRNIYLPVDQAGCGNGGGINVDTNNVGTTETVTIANNVVANYNIIGIGCFDSGVVCNIRNNAVSIYVPYTPFDPGPGGIVIYGALGRIFGNTVSGNECSIPVECGPDYITQYQGDGIITYYSGTGTFVIGNTVINNGVGIYTEADTALTAGNVVQNSVWEGLVLFDGTYTPLANRISGSPLAILVGSDGFVDNPVVCHLSFNDFIGTFSEAIVQDVAYTGEYGYGGPYVEPATATIDGLSVTVTPGPSGTPSYVNITSLPGW